MSGEFCTGPIQSRSAAHSQVAFFATAAAQTYQPRFCSLIAAMILDTVHFSVLDNLRHTFFMREVISNFKLMLYDYDTAATRDDRPDFVEHGIDPATIPLEVAPLLDWFSSEQVHGPDYRGPLSSSS